MVQLQQVFIEDWFTDHVANLKTIAATRSVVQEDLHEMNSLFDSLYANYTEYSDISYANKEGKVQVSTVENEGIDVSDRVYFKRAQQGYTHKIGRASCRER